MPTNICRHIRPSGRRCQAVALRHRPFCYHHESANSQLRALHPPQDGTYNIIHPLNLAPGQLQREPMVAEYYANSRGPIELNFPPLEDADAIQLALSMVLTALGQNRIDPKRAAAMLYNLQIASSNVRKLSNNETNTVRDFVTDETGTVLAPDEDPEDSEESEHQPNSVASFVRNMLTDIDREQAEAASARPDPAPSTSPHPHTPPTLTTNH